MNVDHYTRGKSELNRDYALSGLNPFPFVIVADGCSSTKYSEVGALILAHAARNVLGRYSKQVIDSYEAFGKAVLSQAESVANLLGRPKEILDATLVLAWVDGENIKFRMYGDGLFLLQSLDGSITIVKSEFDNNMPFYLSYRADNQRLVEYEKQVTLREISTFYDGSLGRVVTEKFNEPCELSFVSNQHRAFAVSSDGFSQLLKEDSTFIELPKVIEQAFALKSTAGSFMTKRIRRMLSEYETQGVKQLDDISISMICL